MRYSIFPTPPNFCEVMEIPDWELRAETAFSDGFAGIWLVKACSGKSDVAVLGRMLGQQDESDA